MNDNIEFIMHKLRIHSGGSAALNEKPLLMQWFGNVAILWVK